MSPARAILLHSPGRKPWVSCHRYILSPKGAALSQVETNALAVSAAPTELILLLSVCTQGFISGFALISPWAMNKWRAYGTHSPPHLPLSEIQQ